MKVRSTVFLAAVLACFLSLGGSAIAAAPANDNFGNPEALSYGSLINGTNVEATAQSGAGEGTHGGVAASHSVWYSFTPAHSGRAEVAIYSGDFQPVGTVYTGSALGGLTKTADSSEFETKEGEFEGVNEEYVELKFKVVAGQKYSFAADTGDGTTGKFELFALEPLAATNDDFADAEALPENSGGIGTTTETTAEASEPKHGGVNASHSVWYDFTATETGRAVISVFSGEFTPVGTVYSGSAIGNLTKIVDGNEFIPFAELPEGAEGFELVFDAVKGATYKVAIDTGDGLTGEFSINAFELPTEVNDAFATPVTLNGDSAGADGNTGIATAGANEPAHSGYGAYGSLWYSWTAGSNGPTTLTTKGSTSDTRLAVYSGGSITVLTSLGESDDVSETDRTSQVTFTATQGTNYRIVVDNGRSAGEPYGPFHLSLSHPPSAAPTVNGGATTPTIDTAIAKAPQSVRLKGKGKKAKVTFKFASASAGAGFECSVDNGVYKPCPSTFSVSLKKGRHTIQVRAKDAAGAVDSTPATATVKVKPAAVPKKHH